MPPPGLPLLAVRSLLLLVLLLFGTAVRAEPKVLASIKPLALIAEEVMAGRGQTDTLLQGAASPHDYALRVSDIQRLRSADIVLWVGPEMETFLVRSLAHLPAESLFEAQQLAGIHWPKGGEDAGTSHKGTAHRNTAHNGHFHQRDPHIWLNPRNGALIARALAERLSELDPEGSERYHSNAERLAQHLQQLDHTLQPLLQPLGARGFAVYHEGYSHFIEHYGLTQLGYVTVGPEQRPGARHLHQLRQRLAGAHCLFTEPYYDTQIAAELARELGLSVGELDPLGVASASYPQLLEVMAQAFLNCLAPQR